MLLAKPLCIVRLTPMALPRALLTDYVCLPSNRVRNSLRTKKLTRVPFAISIKIELVAFLPFK